MAVYPLPKLSPAAAKRAGIYIRVSGDEQEDNGSLEDQQKACQRLAEQEGWQVVAVYRDVDSGADPERPQFHAMCAAIEQRELDAVVCWKRDRLGRDGDAIGYVQFIAKRAGADIQFVINQRANTTEGRVLNALEDANSEKERTDIALRTQGGMRRRVIDERRYFAGSRPPYGYQWADPHKPDRVPAGQKARAKTTLVPDPQTAPVVKRVFEHIAGGGSVRSIARLLEADRIATPDEYVKGLTPSKPWPVTTIRIIVRNPAYKGQPQAYRWKVARPKLATVAVPLDPITEPIPVNGVTEALVSPDLWHRANQQLDHNQEYGLKRGQDPESTLLRAGYAVCGYCGHPLIAAKDRSGYAYRCAANNRRDHGCPSFSISARVLDEAVWSKVKSVLSDPAYVRQYMQEWLEAGDTTKADLERVEAELVAIEVKVKRLLPQLVQLDDPAPVHQMLNDLTARKRVLLVEQNNLKLRRQTYQRTLERWDAMLARWDWQGEIDHPKFASMSYADQRFWLANLNVEADVWQKGGGPEGQQYRITMAIDESFWLPSEDELTGAWESDHARLQESQPATYHASLESYLSTRL